MAESYMRVPLESPGVASRAGSRPVLQAPQPAPTVPATAVQPHAQPHHKAKAHKPPAKDRTKGWKRYWKKVQSVMKNAKDTIENCCGTLYDDGSCAEPLTIETLEDAVRDPDAEQVERLINAGVQVNAPIDERGSTVLDALAKEFLQMLEDCEEYRYRGVGSDALTEMFIDHNRAFHEVTHLLHDAGAQFSDLARKHDLYIE